MIHYIFTSLEYSKYSYTDKVLMLTLLLLLVSLIIGANYYNSKKKKAKEIKEEEWPLYRSKDVLMQDKPKDNDGSSPTFVDDGSKVIKILLIFGLVIFIGLLIFGIFNIEF